MKLITWQQSYKHRHAHQEAWLTVLRLPNIPSRTQRRVLQHLSTYVLSNEISPSPLRFTEYFTTSFKVGVGNGNNSLAAILSLHGLFILMLDHQLEYPQFYNSLYQLLHPRILYTKHRTRFLRLLSKSLSSNSMLPAYVVASFCKRLCRLALSGPPSGGLFVLALVSNLLRKHGECACLIHRRGKDEDGGLIEDVFAEDVNDLIKTRGERCENL
jgi:U3 small nucleolar RNA-associated protein 19